MTIQLAAIFTVLIICAYKFGKYKGGKEMLGRIVVKEVRKISNVLDQEEER